MTQRHHRKGLFVYKTTPQVTFSFQFLFSVTHTENQSVPAHRPQTKGIRENNPNHLRVPSTSKQTSTVLCSALSRLLSGRRHTLPLPPVYQSVSSAAPLHPHPPPDSAPSTLMLSTAPARYPSIRPCEASSPPSTSLTSSTSSHGLTLSSLLYVDRWVSGVLNVRPPDRGHAGCRRDARGRAPGFVSPQDLHGGRVRVRLSVHTCLMRGDHRFSPSLFHSAYRRSRAGEGHRRVGGSSSALRHRSCFPFVSLSLSLSLSLSQSFYFCNHKIMTTLSPSSPPPQTHIQTPWLPECQFRPRHSAQKLLSLWCERNVIPTFSVCPPSWNSINCSWNRLSPFPAMSTQRTCKGGKINIEAAAGISKVSIIIAYWWQGWLVWRRYCMCTHYIKKSTCRKDSYKDI